MGLDSFSIVTFTIFLNMVAQATSDIPPFICNLDDYECVCNPAERKIDCENKGIEHFMLIPGDFKDYGYISLRNNYIKAIAPESVIKEYYPQLRELDVRDNPDFHCSSLAGFSSIRIISDCPVARPTTTTIPTTRAPDPTTTTQTVTSKQFVKIVENCNSDKALYVAIGCGMMTGFTCFCLVLIVQNEIKVRKERQRDNNTLLVSS